MKTLIIGAGEVGQALKQVLSKAHEVLIRDIEPIDIGLGSIEVLQICYPDSDRFVEITKNYIALYKPTLTIVNSSVSVGTTTSIGVDVVYSPIRGRHPGNGLQKEMMVFTKFVGCRNEVKLAMAAEYFKQCGWDVASSDNPEALEYLKLMSNVHMGLEIAWRQEVERMMKKFKIDPVVYDDWERTYSEGYRELGQYHLMRSRMNPAPIGGHCILPCTEILNSQFPSKAMGFILESNETAQKDR